MLFFLGFFRFQCPSRSNVGEFLIGTFSLLFVVGFLPWFMYLMFLLKTTQRTFVAYVSCLFGVCFSFLPFD